MNKTNDTLIKRNNNQYTLKDLVGAVSETTIKTSRPTPRLRLEMTNDCTNKCAYCHVGLANNKKQITNLKYKDCSLHISNFIELTKKHLKTNAVHINFYGGEALIQWSIIKKLLDKFKNEHNGTKITWNINTNGTLLSDDILRVLAKYNVGVHIGCDGPKEINDKYRRTKDGKSNFEKLSNALNKCSEYGLYRQIDSVISKNNIDHLPELIDSAEKLHVQNIYLDLLYKPNSLLDPIKTATKYHEAVEYGKDHHISVGGTPTNLLSRIKNNHVLNRETKEDMLRSITVSSKNEIYYSLSTIKPLSTNSLIEYFSGNNKNWGTDFNNRAAELKTKCNNCFLNKHCGNNGILQYEYHTQKTKGYDDVCLFLKEFVLQKLIDEDLAKKTNYRVSNYYKTIPIINTENFLAYHSLFGTPLTVTQQMKDILDSLQNQSLNISKMNLDAFVNHNLIVHKTDEDKQIKRLITKTPENKITHLRLSLSDSCNLNCKYCYVPNNGKNMSAKTAKLSVDKFLNLLKKGQKQGSITFFGGEPFLNWKALEQTVEHIDKKNPDKKLIESMQVVTNGTLITKKQIEFLKKHKVHVAISVDGTKKTHDKIRTTKNGTGTFDTILASINKMKSLDYPPSGLVCTVGTHNINDLNNLVEFSAKEELSLTINNAFAEPKDLKLDDEILANKIFDAFLLAQKLKVRLSGTWMRPFERLFGSNQKLRHCAAVGAELAVNSNGFIKPCPGFDKSFGHIDNLEAALTSKEYREFSKRTAPNIKECKGCEIEGLCAGGCMLNAHKAKNKDYTKKADSCELFKNLFHKIVQHRFEHPAIKQLYNIKSQGVLRIYSDKNKNLPVIQTYESIFLKLIDLFKSKLDLTLKPFSLCLFFDKKTYHNLHAGRLPSWAKGHVSKDIIFLCVKDSDKKTTDNLLRGLAHELGHVLTYQQCGKLPNWFDEGICEYIAHTLFPNIKKTITELKYPQKLDWFFDNKNELLIYHDHRKPLENKLYHDSYLFIKDLLKDKTLHDLLEHGAPSLIKHPKKKDFHVTLINTTKLFRYSFPPYGLGLINASLHKKHISAELFDLDIVTKHENSLNKDPVDLDCLRNHYESLYALLKNKNHDTYLDDQFEKLLAKIDLTKTSVVGLNAHDDEIYVSLILAKKIKEKFGCTIIIGGSHVIRITRERLEYFINDLKMDYVDYFVRDGEFEIFEKIKSKTLEPKQKTPVIYPAVESKNAERTHNTYFLNFDIPKYNKKHLNYYKIDINKLEYFYHHIKPPLLDKLKESNGDPVLVLPYLFTKGCPNNCAFCFASLQKYEQECLDHTIENIKAMQKEYNCNHFYFLNNNIVADRKYATKLFTRLKKETNIKWSDASSIKGLDKDMAKLMSDSGCIQLLFGLESGSQKQLEYVHKNTNYNQISYYTDCFKNLHDNNIWVVADIIAGMPYETNEDINASISYVDRMKKYINGLIVLPFSLYESSIMRKKPEKYKIKIVEEKKLRKKIKALYGPDVDVYKKIYYRNVFFSEADSGLDCWEKEKQIEESKKTIQSYARNNLPTHIANHYLIFYLYEKFKKDKKEIMRFLQ